MMRRGHEQEAFALGYRALNLARRAMGSDARSVASCLRHLAWLHAYAGCQLDTHELFLRLSPQAEPPGLPVSWPSRRTMTTFRQLVEGNRFDEAFDLGNQALRWARTALSPSQAEIAFWECHLAWLFASAGCYPEAHRFQRRALNSYLGDRVVTLTGGEVSGWVVDGEHPFLIEVLFRLALCEFLSDDLPLAQDHVALALALASDRHSHVVQQSELLRLVGRILARASKTKRAILAWQEAEALTGEVPRLATTLRLAVLSDQAQAHQAAGDHARAAWVYRELYRLQGECYGKRHPATVVALNWLACALLQAGQFKEAEMRLDAFLHAARLALPAHHPDLTRACSLLAILASFHNDPQLTQRRLHDAITEANQQSWHLASRFSEQEWMGSMWLSLHSDLVLSLVVSRLANVPEAVGETARFVLLRKGLAAEMCAIRRDRVRKHWGKRGRQKYEKLAQLRRRLARGAIAGPGSRQSREDYRQEIDTWKLSRALLERALARQFPAANASDRPAGDSAEDIARQLPAGTALVVFVRYQRYQVAPRALKESSSAAHYLAFVMRGGTEGVFLADLGEAENIDRLISDYRRMIDTAPTFVTARPLKMIVEESDHVLSESGPYLGVQLRQKLVDSLRPALGGVSRLLLCLDGDLARLPFESLPEESPGRCLLDSYQISYLASGRDLFRIGKPRQTAPTAPIVAADPDFDLGTTQGQNVSPADSLDWQLSACSREMERSQLVERLPASSQEGERVARLLGVTPWLAGAVVKQKLLPVRSPVILHLATHGFFLPDQAVGRVPADPGDPIERLRQEARLENPLLRSGLLLAGFNTWRRGLPTPEEAETGVLTAEEVLTMDLSGTELVVLSACETGLGEVHAGEGVFGLQRAFRLAGARTLVMSLWKVPDLATAVLMERFYENLLRRRMPRDESLREAQQFLRECTLEQLRRAGWLERDWLDRLAARTPEQACVNWAWQDGPRDSCPFADPYYWGAFICQGDPSPLPESALPPADRPQPQ